MPEADITPIHNLLERAIQGVNLDRAQGSMIGDGGYVHLYLWEGTVAIAAHMNKLGSTAEQGADVRSLIADLSRRFPEGFIK
jgi:hypothetical protein